MHNHLDLDHTEHPILDDVINMFRIIQS